MESISGLNSLVLHLHAHTAACSLLEALHTVELILTANAIKGRVVVESDSEHLAERPLTPGIYSITQVHLFESEATF